VVCPGWRSLAAQAAQLISAPNNDFSAQQKPSEAAVTAGIRGGEKTREQIF
jgi:hypothetical protein